MFSENIFNLTCCTIIKMPASRVDKFSAGRTKCRSTVSIRTWWKSQALSIYKEYFNHILWGWPYQPRSSWWYFFIQFMSTANPIWPFSFSICQIRDRKCIIVGTSSGLGDKYLIIPSLSPCQYHTQVLPPRTFFQEKFQETQQKMFRLWAPKQFY